MAVNKKDMDILLKGAGIVFIGTLFGKFLMYLTKMFLARYLGPSDYGLFALSFTVFMMLVTFSGLGMNIGVVRFVAMYASKKRWTKVKGVIYSAIKVVFPVSVAVSLITFIYADSIAMFFSKPIAEYIRIFSLISPIFVLAGIFSGVLQGLKRMKELVLTNNVYSNIILFLFSLLGAIYFGIFGAVLGFSIGYISRFIISILYSKDVFRKSKKSSEELNKLLRFSFPLTIVAIIWTVAGYIDTLMLGYFSLSKDVGIYNVSYIVANLLMIIYSAFTSIYYPIGSEYFSKRKNMMDVYKRVAIWMSIISFPMFIVMFFFPSAVLSIFFGSKYISGSVALSILSLAFFISIIVGPCAETLNILGKTKYNTLNILVMVIIDFILNYMLIPIYGIVGCAIATSIAIVVLNLLGLFEVFLLVYKDK